MSQPDYYELLGVSRGAVIAEIKASYRKKAFEFHPDRNPGNKEAEDMFKLVAEAYDVLSNEQKRHIYDQFGHAGLSGGMGHGGGFTNAEDIFSAFGDIFEDFFGSQGGRSSRGSKRARRGSDSKTEVTIDFLEACFGVQKEVSVPQVLRCETCLGSGAKKGTSPVRCSYCNGYGQVQMSQGFFTINTTCPQCRGQGNIIKEHCESCRGEGVLHKTRKLKVKIPPGVNTDTRLVMQGEGDVGQNGGPHGDLYVLISVTDHPEFRREEDDIHSILFVSFSDLALGCDKTANTIDGTTDVKIKVGQQSGEMLRLKGKGVANVRSGRRGDHILHIQAQTPQDLLPRQKQLFEELKQEHSDVTSTTSHTKKKKKSFFN
jgi:molecular chaperone DnaJ